MADPVIENFIKKVKLANTSNSKEVRFPITELNDLVASIALLNASSAHQKFLEQKIDSLINTLKTSSTTQAEPPAINGGGFK